MISRRTEILTQIPDRRPRGFYFVLCGLSDGGLCKVLRAGGADEEDRSAGLLLDNASPVLLTVPPHPGGWVAPPCSMSAVGNSVAASSWPAPKIRSPTIVGFLSGASPPPAKTYRL